MPEYLQILILFGVGNLAAFINVMAGGGSVITLPVLIFMGLDSALANGTNRIGTIAQDVFATLSFRKEKVSQIRRSFELSVLTLPGAILGALLAVRIGDKWFERILGVVMIVIVISMLFPRSSGEDVELSVEGKRNWLIYPVMFGVGLYGGFIQAGVGIIFLAAFYHILRMNLVFANMHKVFIILIYTIPALFIFIWTGNVDWKLGVALATGTAFGGWWAARISVRSGERIIRYVLVVAVFIMAIRLLGIL